MSVPEVSADALVVSTGHRPMGFSEFVIVIAAIMALNPLAMDMMLPALPNIGAAFHIDVPNRLQMVLSAFLIGFGVGQFVIGRCPTVSAAARCCSAAWWCMRRQPARDRGALVRDAAAGARAGGPRHRCDARDRDLDRARLLCRPPHGERGVAGDDGVHRGPRDRALVRPGRDAADAMARHLHRADALWHRRAGVERDTAAGDAAGIRAQAVLGSPTCSARSARP